MNDESIFSQPFDEKMMEALQGDEKAWFKYRLGEETPSFGEIIGLPGARTGRWTRAREEREAAMKALMLMKLKSASEMAQAPPTHAAALEQNPTAYGLSGIRPSLSGIPQPSASITPPVDYISPGAQGALMQQRISPPQASAYLHAIPKVPEALLKKPTTPEELAKQDIRNVAMQTGDWDEIRRLGGTLEKQKGEKDELAKFTEMLTNAGVDPKSPEGQQYYRAYAQKTTTHPDPAKQVTNVNAFLPASEEAQRDFMKSTRATYDQLKQAPVLLENIDRAKALVPAAKGFMGTGGETLLEAAKFLNNRLGMSVNIAGVKSAEELRSRIFFNIMDNLKKMDAQPSQLQQQIMMDSLGKLGTDPNALPAVLDAYADVIRGKVDLHNKEVLGAVTRGVKFPYDPTITLFDYKKIPSGSVYKAPDGTMRRKP